MIDVERLLKYTKIEVYFPQAGTYDLRVEVESVEGKWIEVASATEAVTAGPLTLALPSPVGRRVRVSVETPDQGFAGITEVRIYGFVQTQ